MSNIRTYADREAHILALAQMRKSTPVTRTHWAAHIARLRLIYAPFPEIRRIGTGSALPWSGTIIGDTFYGDGDGYTDRPAVHRGAHAAEGTRDTNLDFEREETV